MMHLYDPEDGALYEVCYDHHVRNYGLLGGWLHVRIVRHAMVSFAHRLIDNAKDLTCNIQGCVRDRQTIFSDGFRMGDKQFARCAAVELIGAYTATQEVLAA